MSEHTPEHARHTALLGPLSLTPLLGVTDSLVRAVGLLIVLWVVSGVHALIYERMLPLSNTGSRLLASALLAALLVSCAELALQAQALALYQGLGVYVTLVGVHCVASQATDAALDPPASGQRPSIILFSALMLILAGVRELLGNGTLLNHAQWLFGLGAAKWQLQVFSSGAHLALLAPGGFILLGLLLAAHNAWNGRTGNQCSPDPESTPRSSSTTESLPR